MSMRRIVPALGLLAVFAFAQPSATFQDPLRGPVPIAESTRPPLLGNAVNDDVRRMRAYDMQPPTIPHRVDGYQIDKNLNARLGFGWGFRSGPKTTVGVRLDLHYWLLSLSDYDPDRTGSPVPSMVPRPQQTFSVLIGLEFMRWK